MKRCEQNQDSQLQFSGFDNSVASTILHHTSTGYVKAKCQTHSFVFTIYYMYVFNTCEHAITDDYLNVKPVSLNAAADLYYN